MKRVIVLGSSHSTTRIAVNALLSFESVDVRAVVVEKRVSRFRLLQNRLRRLGVAAVLGQLLFAAYCAVALKRRARRRNQETLRACGLTDSEIPSGLVQHVDSVASPTTRKWLMHNLHQMDVVVVIGTRIIPQATLDIIDVPIVNLHAGITPSYRGVHGAYWAMVRGDLEHCGTTLHYVDAGIDTGGVIGQSLIHVTPEDNFLTYPVLQLVAGLKLLEQYLLDGRCSSEVLDNTGRSQLWTHPTLTQYLRQRVA